jgi:hypothetical protein
VKGKVVGYHAGANMRIRFVTGTRDVATDVVFYGVVDATARIDAVRLSAGSVA